MVTLLFLQAWGAHAAQTIAKVSDSQAEPLIAVGIAVPVSLAPDPFAASAAPEPSTTVGQRAPRKPKPMVTALGPF